MSTIERVEFRNVDLETPLGRFRATRALLSQVTLPSPSGEARGGPVEWLAGLRIGELRLEGATLEAKAAAKPATGDRRRRWRLEPLAALEGTLRADIVAAAWLFAAEVTIPVAAGRVDFDQATVEHVGPDSSMGISRMGVYVDAPNGRNYLYLLSATHVPGVRFEQRGLSLASWTSERGAIDLRPFFECLVTGMPIGALATGASDMLARTRLGGSLALGDGVMGDERNRLVLGGRAHGRNRIELSSGAAPGGIVVRIPQLSATGARFETPAALVLTGAVAGMLSVQVALAPGGPAATIEIAEMTVRDVACADAAQA